MKLNNFISKWSTNKTLLNVIYVLTVFNVIGYMMMGNLNLVLFFIVMALLLYNFTKNMTYVLGIPLVFVNLVALSRRSIEGMENATPADEDGKKKKIAKKVIEKKSEQKKASANEAGLDVDSGAEVEHDDAQDDPMMTTDKSGFEIGKKKGSKIDYATTVEDAYDELNKILGSDGIKRLTDDTQHLMKQQMQLAEAMKGMGPIIKNIEPMMKNMKDMMSNMGDGNNGLGSIMNMAKSFAQ
jgi:hypothetical protein